MSNPSPAELLTLADTYLRTLREVHLAKTLRDREATITAMQEASYEFHALATPAVIAALCARVKRLALDLENRVPHLDKDDIAEWAMSAPLEIPE
jgi:hypothetical protein